MTEKDLQDGLLGLCNDEGCFLITPPEGEEGPCCLVTDVRTFEEIGEKCYARKNGVVVTLDDGSVFELTIKKLL